MDEEILNLLIKSTTYKGISPSEEKTVIQYLRLLTEPEAYDILQKMVKMKSNNVLPMARRVLNDKKIIVKFFRAGLVNADASTIKQWLKFAISKLGEKATVEIVYEYRNFDISLVEKSLYWFPSLISKNNRGILFPLINCLEQTEG
jgi:hypothetical protein